MQLNKKCIYLFSYYSFHSYYFASEYKTDHSSPNYFLAAQISRLPSSDRILSGSDLGEIPNVKSYPRLRPESGTRQGLSDITQIMFISSLAWDCVDNNFRFMFHILHTHGTILFHQETLQFLKPQNWFKYLWNGTEHRTNICGMGWDEKKLFSLVMARERLITAVTAVPGPLQSLQGDSHQEPQSCRPIGHHSARLSSDWSASDNNPPWLAAGCSECLKVGTQCCRLICPGLRPDSDSNYPGPGKRNHQNSFIVR